MIVAVSSAVTLLRCSSTCSSLTTPARSASARSGSPPAASPSPFAVSPSIRQVISRLAQSYGVETVFVWQPIPTYKYDFSHDLLGPRQPGLGPAVYALVDKIEAGGSLGRDFLNLSGVQHNQTQNLYVDPWHYTAAFTAEIARRIAQFLGRPR